MILNFIEKTDYRKSGFQDYDNQLGLRLLEVLKSNGIEYNHYVGIPGCFFNIGTSYLCRRAAKWWWRISNGMIDKISPHLNKNQTYLDSTFTRFYLSHKNKSNRYQYVQLLKKIWDNRNCIIVEGEKSKLGVGNDLFENARSIQRIVCPATNAWHRYDDILNTIVCYVKDKDSLILLALGMTATILSYDLAIKGYQAIDIGHVDIEYEWMLMGATEKVPIPGKFTNETDGQSNYSLDLICANKYKSEIIAHV